MDNKNGILGGIVNWLQHPFTSDGSAFNWVMFVGLLVIAAFLWQTVLLKLTEEI
jgi:uncharacterized protein (DUF983 family)